MNIEELQKVLRTFAAERDWDQFHSPKNLVMALSAECGELMEVFQWLTEEESKSVASNPKRKTQAEEEVADVALYLLRLCDKLEIDLDNVVRAKVAKNAEKYPVNLAKGKADKYTEFKRPN